MGLIISYYAETANDEINPLNIAAGLIRGGSLSVDDLEEITDHLLAYTTKARSRDLKGDSGEKEPESVTYGDIYKEFQSNYPEFAKDVEDYRPYFPPYRTHAWPMNIVIWLRSGEVKRYSYETKVLYPERDE